MSFPPQQQARVSQFTAPLPYYGSTAGRAPAVPASPAPGVSVHPRQMRCRPVYQTSETRVQLSDLKLLCHRQPNSQQAFASQMQLVPPLQRGEQERGQARGRRRRLAARDTLFTLFVYFSLLIGGAAHVDSPRPIAERRLIPRWFQTLIPLNINPGFKMCRFKFNLRRCASAKSTTTRPPRWWAKSSCARFSCTSSGRSPGCCFTPSSARSNSSW
jgi:hypothetical protein